MSPKDKYKWKKRISAGIAILLAKRDQKKEVK